MYPDVNYQPYGTPPRRSARKWAVVAVAILLLTVLAITLWPRTEYREYKLDKTALKATQHFAQLDGSDLYSFNGLGFYKTDTRSGEVSMLRGGLRLPEPDRIYWADDKGALMTFQHSFSLTAVDNALRAQGLRLNAETEGYSWYVDFATGQLQLASTTKVRADQALYSQAESGFFTDIIRDPLERRLITEYTQPTP